MAPSQQVMRCRAYKNNLNSNQQPNHPTPVSEVTVEDDSRGEMHAEHQPGVHKVPAMPGGGVVPEAPDGGTLDTAGDIDTIRLKENMTKHQEALKEQKDESLGL